MRVLVVDDHADAVKGLSMLLATDSHNDVVGTARSGREAIKKARELHPDVVVMDYAMDDIDGLEAASMIRSESAQTEVIIMSVFEQAQYAERARSAGVRKWITKGTPAQELLREVEEIRKFKNRENSEGGAR